jgi:cytochrome c-type biogenesis protein CcmH
MTPTPTLLTRRRALAAGFAALVPAALRAQGPQDTDGVARLPRPDAAGQPRDRVTDYENDPFIVGVEGKLRCTCGCNLSVYTCRTTDFTCATSPAMHQQVIALVEEGKTAQEILDAFVAQHGETVLMAPIKEGFNIAAYVVPGIAIAAAGSVMSWILVRRMRRSAAESATLDDAGAEDPDLAAEDRVLLEAELERLER